MKIDILKQHQIKLEEEIKLREKELKYIEEFESKCNLFLENNKDYAPADKEIDFIAKTLITIEKLNNLIEDNSKDIENILISQNALKQVVSVSNEKVIEALTKDIEQIKDVSEKIEIQIEEIYNPLSAFLEMKIDCPYCSHTINEKNYSSTNSQCSFCKNSKIVKLKTLYETNTNKNLYSENNIYAVSQQNEKDNEELYENITEETNEPSQQNKKTKFILSRENIK